MGRIARRAMRTAARLSPPRLATRLLSAIEARRTRSSVSEVTGPSLKAQQVGAGGSAVVLAADALVVPYRRSLAQAAAIAREEGLRVIVLRCRGALGACISKRFSGIEPAAMGTQVDSICTLCALSGAAEPMPAGCEVRWMEQLTDVEQGQLDERLLGELPAEALARHEVDGVPIGAICASELLHNMRLLRVDARDPNQEAVMRSKIRAAVRSLRAFQSLMKTETVSVLIHFSDYSYHLVAAMAARRAGVRVVNLTHPALFNVSPVRVIALPRTTLEHCYTMVHAWPRFAERPLPPERVELLSRDQIFRMTGGGSHIFSPVRGDAPQALRDRLRIDLGRPVVVAFTSSPDELNSIELWSSAVGIDLATFPDPFDSQIAWLEYTAEALASEPSSPLLVVRLHPREGSRGGSEAQSEHLRLLRTRLEHRPELRVIWPDDAISSYDLGEIATCVNTSWSSLGQEFSRAGAEVVRAFGMKVPIPLGVFSRYSASKQGYSAELRRSLVAPPSLKRITSALRWHNLEYLGSAFDPGERAPATGGSRWPRWSGRCPSQETRSRSRRSDTPSRRRCADCWRCFAASRHLRARRCVSMHPSRSFDPSCLRAIHPSVQMGSCRGASVTGRCDATPCSRVVWCS